VEAEGTALLRVSSIVQYCRVRKPRATGTTMASGAAEASLRQNQEISIFSYWTSGPTQVSTAIFE
jgi:hypothetical protein